MRMQKNGRCDNSLCTEIKSSIEISSVNEKGMPLSVVQIVPQEAKTK